MLGVFINTAAVIAGSLIGLLFRRGIPERVSGAVMTAIGICTLYIGISGAFAGEQMLITIVSLVLGAIVGTLLDIDGKLAACGAFFERKLGCISGSGGAIAQGFVTGSLLFCIGAMTIVGCLNAGLRGDYEMLFTKSLLDFISSMMLSVSLGMGVLLSSIFVLVFQGGIVLLAGVLQPLLSDAAIAEMTCAGSLMIVMIGLNLLGITKIKTADYLPAIVFAPILCAIVSLVSGG